MNCGMNSVTTRRGLSSTGSGGLASPTVVDEGINNSPSGINATFFTSILYFALFPSLVAYFCWNRGVELIGANRAGLFINLIPIFASFMAVIWLKESLEWFHVMGLLLVLGGMALFNR